MNSLPRTPYALFDSDVDCSPTFVSMDSRNSPLHEKRNEQIDVKTIPCRARQQQLPWVAIPHAPMRASN